MTNGTIVCMHALHWRVTVVGVGHGWAGSYFILFLCNLDVWLSRLKGQCLPHLLTCN